MPNKSRRGMASGDTGKIAFAVIAFVAAIVFVVLYIKSQQGHEVGHIDSVPGHSLKQNAMNAMKGGAAGGGMSPGDEGLTPVHSTGGTPAPDTGDRNQDSHGNN